ncbi:MAG: methionine biosynthesis protein MetW [Candidatus Korobacteraceae bacterium]
MSQPQPIEEIMQRIRTQLGAPDRDGARNNNIAQAKDTQTAEIMERLRQKSRSPQQADGKKATDAPTPITLRLHESSQLRAEIQTALEGTRQVGQINPRNPGLINNVIQTAKKVMRRSLTWYTRPLHRFQGGVVRALDQIAAILDNHNDSLREVATELRNHAKAIEEGSALLTREQAAFEQKGAGLELKLGETEKLLEVKLRDASLAHEARIAAAMAAQGAALTAATSPHSQQIARLFEELEALRSELLKTRAELHEVTTRGRGRDRDVRRTLYSLQHGPARRDNDQPATPPMFASEVKSDKEFDYFAFEDLYRGEEADIRSRQQEYLEYFRGRENVVDIGCGRGEFLELLRDNNISARGVELGLDQYLLCKEKGLDVVQRDLFAFLESLSDESLGGLFSAQVIER